MQSTAITVVYTREGFTPDKVKIEQAEAIEFVNSSQELIWPASNIHPTHHVYPEFDPGQPISPGENWRFVFDQAGE